MPITNGLTEIRCKGCDEPLREIELRYMTEHNLEKCVKCREKDEKNTQISTSRQRYPKRTR